MSAYREAEIPWRETLARHESLPVDGRAVRLLQTRCARIGGALGGMLACAVGLFTLQAFALWILAVPLGWWQGRWFARRRIVRLLADVRRPTDDPLADLARLDASPTEIVREAAARLERASITLPLLSYAALLPLAIDPISLILPTAIAGWLTYRWAKRATWRRKVVLLRDRDLWLLAAAGLGVIAAIWRFEARPILAACWWAAAGPLLHEYYGRRLVDERVRSVGLGIQPRR